MHQILKVGGLFVIEVPNPESKATSHLNHFFKAYICYFKSLSLIGLLKDNFLLSILKIMMLFFKFVTKYWEDVQKPNNRNSKAVRLAEPRLKH